MVEELNLTLQSSNEYSNKTWIFTTCYTENSPYEIEARNLRRSCRKVKAPLQVFSMPSLGDWLKNIRATNLIIARALKQTKKNIVWIDSDARVFQYPDLFDIFKSDIGLYMPKVRKGHNYWTEYATGTMFFKNNERVRLFWDDYCEQVKDMDIPAQAFLGGLLIKSKSIKLSPLPYNYCYIADPVPAHGLLETSKIVILQRKGMKRYAKSGFRSVI